jgi:porin
MSQAIQRYFQNSKPLSSSTVSRSPALALLSLLLAASPLHAYDVNDKLSISGVAAATVQCQEIDGASNGPDRCEGGFPFQPEISFNAEGANSAFVKLGFAADNGLNLVSPFALASWAADLEDDVKKINGRNRDHILTAWYRRRFALGNDTNLAVTGGLIDATDYLDDNAFANDEYGQFMNEAFVNAPTAFLPSYDWGGVVEFDRGSWSFRALVMQVGENDDGNAYTFFGGQAAYTRNTSFGEGTYRVVVGGTNSKFLDPMGVRQERLSQITLSVDQQLGETVGIFIRFGWQDDAAAITYDALYSGGLSINGRLWGRSGDTIGIAYAHLNGGNGDVNASHAGEVYYRFAINEHLAVTGDIQLLRDKVMGGGGPKGAIFSIRGTKEF